MYHSIPASAYGYTSTLAIDDNVQTIIQSSQKTAIPINTKAVNNNAQAIVNNSKEVEQWPSANHPPKKVTPITSSWSINETTQAKEGAKEKLQLYGLHNNDSPKGSGISSSKELLLAAAKSEAMKNLKLTADLHNIKPESNQERPQTRVSDHLATTELPLTNPSRRKLSKVKSESGKENTLKTINKSKAATKLSPDDDLKQKQQIKDIEEQFNVDISHSSNKKFPHKVKGGSLEQSFRFKTLQNMQQALNVGNLRRTAKHLALGERLLRGRDVHNVTSLTKMDTGPVLIIDGGDDLAVSLENSGLPRSLVLAAQSTMLYPAFIGVVHFGWNGANEESKESRTAYKELAETQIELQSKINQSVFNSTTREMALKDALNNALNKALSNPQEKESPKIQLIKDALLANHKFKANLLESVKPLLSSTSDVNSSDDFKEKLNQLTNFYHSFNSASASIAKQVTDISVEPSAELYALLEGKTSDDLLDPKSASCHELILQIAEYKSNQDDKLATFTDAYIASAFTESGLSGMYWGMVSYEARATAELISKNSAESLTSVLSQMGDAFNVIGQAQMVIAGLTKVGLGTNEVYSLNDWLAQIKQSAVLKDEARPELVEVKNIVKQFYRHQRNVVATETLGNAVLTLGQLGMILGGPLGTGIGSLLYAGVGATIGGVGLSQIASQYANKVFNVSQEPSAAEKEISRWTDPKSSPKEIIQTRIEKLYQFSKKQAFPKVWLKIFQTVLKHPNLSAEEILDKVDESYQEYNAEHSGHYRQIYKKAFDSINTEKTETHATINHAKALLTAENKNYTSFSAFMVQHILEQQNPQPNAQKSIEQSTPKQEITKLFDFAEKQGFSKEFEQRIVKRLINTNGYVWNKEAKVDYTPYVDIIEANKSKRAWNIPNPVAPIVNLWRLIKQLVKPVASPSFMSGTINLPINWGKKDTSVYVFNRDKFLTDLQKLSSNEQDSKNIKHICQSLFTEQMVSEVKDWVGKDSRNVFEDTMRKIGKQVLRDNVLRPIVHGVSEQVKLADLLEGLNPLELRKQS